MLKVPFNKISFELVDWGCLQSCNSQGYPLTNEEYLQKLIDEVCSKVDYTEVDLKCLSDKRKESVVDILNLIVTKLCEPTTSTESTIDLSTLVLCGKDNSNYIYNECLQVVNECHNELNLLSLLQAIIKRINSYSFLISQLKLQIDQLTTQVNTNTTAINQLTIKLNNCCQ